jgi:hypothetical protein
LTGWELILFWLDNRRRCLVSPDFSLNRRRLLAGGFIQAAGLRAA